MLPHTSEAINKDVEGKEYALQHTKRGWRCISWYPHYIMTNWSKTMEEALRDAEGLVEAFYNKIT